MKDFIKRYAIWALLLLMVLFPLMLYFIALPYDTSSKAESCVEIVHYPEEGTDLASGMSNKLAYYMGRNEDVIGLLRLEGTLLETPVVCSNPEDAYIRKNLDGEYHTNGTPFLTVDSTIGESGSNLIVFGHNLPDGSQFGALMGYKDLDYLVDHPVIEFESFYGIQSFQIISVFYADAMDEDFVYAFYTQLDSATGTEFLRQIRLRSLYDVQLAASPEDQFITLSTCTYEVSGNRGRFVVVGRMLHDDEATSEQISMADAPLHPTIFTGRV